MNEADDRRIEPHLPGLQKRDKLSLVSRQTRKGCERITVAIDYDV